MSELGPKITAFTSDEQLTRFLGIAGYSLIGERETSIKKKVFVVGVVGREIRNAKTCVDLTEGIKTRCYQMAPTRQFIKLNNTSEIEFVQ